MREIYFAKKSMPLVMDILRKALLFAFIGGFAISIITPIKIQNFENFKNNAIYLVFNNHFFINFIIEKGDYIILRNLKKPFQTKLLASMLSLLSFNFHSNTDEIKLFKIIATKGDQVSINNGILYVNDKEAVKSVSTALNSDFRMILGDNEVFFISLEKETLSDSLLYGTTTRDRIEGKIILK